ncbi:hypothetical protein PENSPDRAFT_688416 [Peniophora sp. CONT]|nr:hypothetical protein PENSPDRAFT_688416 [Peniophora sp. CONT]
MAAPAYRSSPLASGRPYPNEKSGDVFGDHHRVGNGYPNDEKRRSGAEGVGFHLMNATDDDEDDEPPRAPMPTLAAPRPGYAANVAALNARQASPAPSSMPNPFGDDNRVPQMRQAPAALTISRPPVAPINVPSTPHPLPPTMTPIQPVFARPEKSPSEPSVQFRTPLMRSDREGNLARNGEKGDDFWRRFSMIAKDDTAKKESRWLHKTAGGTARWSRWVWVIGLTLLACIGLGVGLGVYSHLTNKSTVQSGPKAIGGSENHGNDVDPSTITAEAVQGAAVGSVAATTSKHVSPTYTVEKRAPTPEPTPNAVGHIPTGHKKQRAKRSAAGLNRLD